MTDPQPIPSAPTVPLLVRSALQRFGERVAFRVRRGDEWAPITFTEYGAALRDCAAGLIELGLEPGACGAILSRNRPEWHEADLAMATAQIVSCPVYATSSAAQVRYILAHASAAVVFAEDDAQRAKVEAVREELPQLRACVVLDGAGCDGGFYRSWEDLLDLGRHAGQLDAELGRRADATRPADLLSIIYTSGTTGPPKGAMLTHRNQVFVVAALDAVIPSEPWHRKLSFLPLSHVGERQISEYLQLQQGFEIWFNEGPDTLGADLSACRPHVQFVVPRVLEKQYDALLAVLDGLPGGRRESAWRDVEVGLRRARLRARHEPVGEAVASAWAAAEEATFRELRRRLGYDDLLLLYSGGAPLALEVLEFFWALGVPLHELYGQTEVSGPLTLNRADAHRFGTVGSAIPGGEVRLADDGEVLYRGDNVCAGYYRDPAATRALVDADGWLHTGDVGTLDADGFLTLTDRKKDLIITAGGKNVAPQLIEAKLKFSPWISQAIVLGDRRRHIAALVSLDEAAVAGFAAHRSIAFDSVADLREHPDIVALVETHVQAVNSELSSAEQVKRFRILPEDLTVASGLLTPTMKVRRRAAEQRYADLITAMYTGADP